VDFMNAAARKSLPVTNLKGLVTISSPPASLFSLSDMFAGASGVCSGWAWGQWLVAGSRDEVKLGIAGGWSDLARRIVHHSQLATRLFPDRLAKGERQLPQRSCDETPNSRRPTTSPLHHPSQENRRHVQSHPSPGYAAHAHDDDAPHPADVHEGQPAAVHEGDAARPQPGARTFPGVVEAWGFLANQTIEGGARR
jgi:hypothetical protein